MERSTRLSSDLNSPPNSILKTRSKNPTRKKVTTTVGQGNLFSNLDYIPTKPNVGWGAVDRRNYDFAANSNRTKKAQLTVLFSMNRGRDIEEG